MDEISSVSSLSCLPVTILWYVCRSISVYILDKLAYVIVCNLVYRFWLNDVVHYMDYTIIGMGVQAVYVHIDLIKTRLQHQRGFLAGELHYTYVERSFWIVITQVIILE